MRKLRKNERKFIDEIGYISHICLYCGEEEKKKWDDYDEYWECDCDDAKKERDIQHQIEMLKQEIPKYNYIVEDVEVIRRITEWTPEQMLIKMSPDEIKRLNNNTKNIIKYTKKLAKK
jgi:hypothetical protein